MSPSRVRRVEDPRLLLGHGRYTDDIAVPGELHATVLRSPHAAARIVSIDTEAARALPGVMAVYTAADLEADGIGGIPCAIPLKNRDGSDRADVPHPVLASGHVRHVGDPVALIVAETNQAARDAAEAILVDYDIAPSVTDLAVAMDAGQPPRLGRTCRRTSASTGKPATRPASTPSSPRPRTSPA